MASLRTQPSDRDQQILRMFNAGATDEEMAADLGVSVSCIRKDRQYLDLHRAPTPAPHVPDVVLQAHHAQGLDNGEIARLAGLTRRTVQERLHRLGLQSHQHQKKFLTLAGLAPWRSRRAPDGDRGTATGGPAQSLPWAPSESGPSGSPGDQGPHQGEECGPTPPRATRRT